MDKIHIPVLLKESIESLNIQPDGFYIDCTLGDGGHSIEILKRLSKEGLLLSLDHDQHAIDFVKEYYKEELKKNDNWIIKKGNFKNIKELTKEISTKPLGILMDIGLSSRQLEESHQRGFSYNEEDEPLDMRMDENLGVTALDLLKVLPEKKLADLFWRYGEERYSKPIAREIKENISDIKTVGDLTRLVYKVVPVNSNKNLLAESFRLCESW
jgi:16S rRNA (cytosine1402-N4)-methyltransferase